jgi:UbiA prenyltransferase family
MSEIHVKSAEILVWRERLAVYWKLVRGDRPIGWLLLLWPTWWGLWLAADGVPPWWTLIVFSLGVWLTRSAGCVINDYADRWLDPLVERTKGRPLATGAVRGREALVVFAVLMLVAFALVLTLNRLTVLMSGVGVALAASYPYLKRHTYLPQVYLGLAFGWGIPMAFAAIRGEVPPLAWVRPARRGQIHGDPVRRSRSGRAGRAVRAVLRRAGPDWPPSRVGDGLLGGIGGRAGAGGLPVFHRPGTGTRRVFPRIPQQSLGWHGGVRGAGRGAVAKGLTWSVWCGWVRTDAKRDQRIAAPQQPPRLPCPGRAFHDKNASMTLI